ncbi:MAG TPA: TatD family hydrolase [Candidatus Cloacimonadota bacterium]|nr:TatD family hydrolase [Candidatus Cloacimonadota bacterium]
MNDVYNSLAEFKPLPGFIDAHCHLADERIAVNLDTEIAEAKKAGVSRFISSALCREEFFWHRQHRFPGIFWCAGIHPFYEKSLESDFPELIKLCDEKEIIAIGEIGLDGRKDNFEWQKRILLQQLDLAMNYDLPVVLHVVRHYYEIYKIIKNNFPKIRGFLHGFNSSQDVAENFAKFDLAFSLGGKPPAAKVVQYIFQRGLLLLETDAPFQKPTFLPSSLRKEQKIEEDFNHLKNLGLIAKKVSEICGCKQEQLCQMQNITVNFLFDNKLEEM